MSPPRIALALAAMPKIAAALIDPMPAIAATPRMRHAMNSRNPRVPARSSRAAKRRGRKAFDIIALPCTDSLPSPLAGEGCAGLASKASLAEAG